MRRGQSAHGVGQRQAAFAQHVQEALFFHIEPGDAAEGPGMEQVRSHAELLQTAFGVVPDMFRTVANSPAALQSM